MKKMTRQGVRDLNSLGTKKTVGIKLDMPPTQPLCEHPMRARHETLMGYAESCSLCGQEWELYAKPNR